MVQAITTSNISNEDILSPPFRVIDCRIYRGPHLYSHTPMINIQVDLGLLEEYPTNYIKGFSKKLIEMLPGLASHGCSLGKPGGFISRLEDGTWMGHVIEHVAIELQSMAGIKVTRGKTRSVKNKPRHYNIMYAYIYEEAGLCAGKFAMDLVSSLLEPPLNRFIGIEEIYDFNIEGGFNLEEAITQLKSLVKKERLGPTSQSLVDEAVRRNIPWVKLDDHSLIQLGTGRYRKLIRASITSNTSNIAVENASDKNLTKEILSEAGIPVPSGYVVDNVEDALAKAEDIGFPVTIKPLDANHGRGVSTNLYLRETIIEAFARAQDNSKNVIIEEHYPGNDYRILVINGEVAAVSHCVPAHVTGNGTDTIKKLIEIINSDPRRGDGHDEILTRISIDDKLVSFLAHSGLTLETIPDSGQHITLAATANLSTGGTSIDYTDNIHPDNALIAERAARIIGLDVAGIDMVIPDISRSWRETGGGIVEVNASPGFRMHLHPTKGKARNVAKPVISALFPLNERANVPVVAITGTNGKSTTIRMLSHILRLCGLRTGFTSTSGIFIGNECIWKGDASGPRSARKLLCDPTIDIALLETARGGILREGMGVESCDVGAVLNVSNDHLGLDGIETVEDIANVKSIVTETVPNDGVSVLNADDPLTFAMAKNAGGSLCYFSMQPDKNAALLEHIEEGGRAVTCEMINGNASIVLYNDGRRIPIAAVNEIPATFSGSAVFNVENALAATSIASALNIGNDIIKIALSSFSSSFEQNPGRFNIYDGHGFRVIMDYAHNPAALRALFEVVRQMRVNHTRVIGNVSTPGDRNDEHIMEIGRIAGQELDLVIFREKPDTRGRPDGEVLRLLSEGARLGGCPENKIICVATEEEATDICLKRARPGELVICSPTSIEACWKQILEFKPFPSGKSWNKPYDEQRLYA